MEEDDKAVDHPTHYTQGKHEVIELTERLDFCLGNAVKYILRAPFKGREVQDLKKARWYLMRCGGNPYTSLVDDNLLALALRYDNPLLKEVFTCLYYGNRAEVLAKESDCHDSPYTQAVEILTKAIHEKELAEVKRELNRCKTELRKAREEKKQELPKGDWTYYYQGPSHPEKFGPVTCDSDVDLDVFSDVAPLFSIFEHPFFKKGRA